jgi:hypothetical protein
MKCPSSFLLVHFKDFLKLFLAVPENSGGNQMDLLPFEDVNECHLLFDGTEELPNLFFLPLNEGIEICFVLGVRILGVHLFHDFEFEVVESLREGVDFDLLLGEDLLNFVFVGFGSGHFLV